MSRRVWVSITHTPGKTYVKVTLKEGDLVCRATAKCYKSTIKQGYTDALESAKDMLRQMRSTGWLDR